MLAQWLQRPLAVKKKIEDRLEIVETFFCENSLLKELRMNLKKTLDVERIISKICRRSGTPRELAGLSSTLDIYDKSFERFREFKSLKNYTINYKRLTQVKTEINRTLNEENGRFCYDILWYNQRRRSFIRNENFNGISHTNKISI